MKYHFIATLYIVITIVSINDTCKANINIDAWANAKEYWVPEVWDNPQFPIEWVPQGPYLKSCMHCWIMHSFILQCQCLDQSEKSLSKSSLNLADCNPYQHEIINQHGHLKCIIKIPSSNGDQPCTRKMGEWVKHKQILSDDTVVLPAGTYLQACQKCELDVDWLILHCHCSNKAGVLHDTSVHMCPFHSTEIINENGDLKCRTRLSSLLDALPSFLDTQALVLWLDTHKEKSADHIVEIVKKGLKVKYQSMDCDRLLDQGLSNIANKWIREEIHYRANISASEYLFCQDPSPNLSLDKALLDTRDWRVAELKYLQLLIHVYNHICTAYEKPTLQEYHEEKFNESIVEGEALILQGYSQIDFSWIKNISSTIRANQSSIPELSTFAFPLTLIIASIVAYKLFPCTQT